MMSDAVLMQIHAIVLTTLLALAGCGTTPIKPASDTPDKHVGGTLTVTSVDTPIVSREYPDQPTTLQFPHVAGGPAGVADAINAQLTPKELTGQEVDAIAAEYADCTCGVVGVAWQTAWNQPSLLQLVVTVDYMGAYPTRESVSFAFDPQTGAVLTAADVFDPAKTGELVKRLDTQLQASLAQAKSSLGPEEREDSGAMFDASFDASDLEGFVFGPDGVTFDFDLDLPHYMQSASPDAPRLEWAAITPYLKPRFRPQGR